MTCNEPTHVSCPETSNIGRESHEKMSLSFWMLKYDDHITVKPLGDGSSLNVRYTGRIEVVVT